MTRPNLHPGACPHHETAMLSVDREFDPIERRAFDAHLATCPACRKAVAEAERLSSILKHWDHERQARVEAPPRLGLEVRQAVERGARRRRSERRRVFLTHVAAAASIVLVLGGGLLLGIARPLPGGSDLVRAVTPSPRAARPLLEGDAPRLELAETDDAAPLGPPRVGTFEVGAPMLASLDGDERAFAKVALVHLEVCRRYADRTEADFARRVGEPAILQTDDRGRMVFLSQGALRFIQDVSGAGSLEGFLQDLRERTGGGMPGHEYADAADHQDTGLVVQDVLPLPKTPQPLKQRLAREAMIGAGSGLRFRAVKLPTAAQPLSGRALDLEEAVRTGRVFLRPGTGDDLVLIAEGLKHPVFLPRGELIQGDTVDRIVARPTWIPAREAKERYVLPCFPVSSVHEPKPIRAIGLVAGPRIRRLLATEGVGRDDVLTQAMRMSPGTGSRYSLLDWYDDAELRRLAKARARQIDRLGWNGFVVSDDEDRLEGVEYSELSRPAGASCLARLWIGYEVEAAITRGDREPEDDPEPLSVTLANLMGFDGTFLAPPQVGGPVRESRLRDIHSGVLVDLYEARERKRPVLVSALR